MSQIFKIAVAGATRIEKIYVFIGNRITDETTIDSINKLFIEEPENEVFRGIFSEDEKEDIEEESTPIVFINQSIHLDDTIETIKKKIMINITEGETGGISFGEIYLFGLEESKLDAAKVYKLLTHNDALQLTKDRFMKFLLNISYEGKSIQEKDIYTYEDILLLDLKSKEFAIKKPVGQYFSANDQNFLYTSNPYDVLVNDEILERHADDFITTTNKNLFMNEITALGNLLYVCFAKDVLEYASSSGLESHTMLSIYYPYLSNNEFEIVDKDTLLEVKEKILEKEIGLISDGFLKKIKDIDIFYEIYNDMNNAVDYNENGLSRLECVLKPSDDILLPLDVVFKLLHATQNIPLMKYNQGKRKENIYRLYTNNKAINGKQIPYLDKGIIFKLMKIMGTEKSVSFYISSTKNRFVLCEINTRGEINIKTGFTDIVNIREIDSIIGDIINPVIDDINIFLSKSGYSIDRYSSLDNKNVKILDANLKLNIKTNDEFNFDDKISNCLSSVFSVSQADIKNGIEMRFKRVANYSEMDAQEALIIDYLNQKLPQERIISGLMDNFSMDESEARKAIMTFITAFQVTADAFRNRKLKSKINPGFRVFMIREQYSNNIIVTISGINHYDYIGTVPIYIDALFKMIQSKDYHIKHIENLCQRVEEEEEVVIDDSEPIDEAQKVEVEEIVFGDKDSDKGGESDEDIFDLLDEDEDEDEETITMKPTITKAKMTKQKI